MSRRKSIVVLHDGGALDGRVMIGDEAFSRMAGARGKSLDDLFALYDGVVVCLSGDGPARVDAAALLAAWGGAPHLWPLDSTDPTDVADAAEAILGTGTELEHKYLINPPDLEGRAGRWAALTQWYLPAPDGHERRVRRSTLGGRTTYTETVKSSTVGLERTEVESEITVERYDQLVAAAGTDAPHIEKQRWTGIAGMCRVEVDHLSYPVDLWLMEIEVLHGGEVIALPDFLDVVREVTDDRAYRNAALAKR